MSPVPLTDEQWSEINRALPNINIVTDRINGYWPQIEWMRHSDIHLLKCLRISNVCFRDAALSLNNTHYALGQAIAVKQYFLSLSKEHKDTNFVLADLRSRFYIDYVSLLLYSVAEHSRAGLVELFGLKPHIGKYKGKYSLKRTCNMFIDKFPEFAATKALTNFDNSLYREKIWNYRDDWVHNKPPRVETVLYNPSREAFINIQEGMVGFGGKIPPDYMWEDLIELLKIGLAETRDFLAV